MDDNPDLAVALRDLVAQYRLPTVLRTLARIMADTGNVTGGIVNEVAAIEEWLAAPARPVPEALD
jgi:hypothetical protein